MTVDRWEASTREVLAQQEEINRKVDLVIATAEVLRLRLEGLEAKVNALLEVAKVYLETQRQP